MIEINAAAKSKIREIYSQNPGKYLRLGVEGDGCAGPYFELSLDWADATDQLTRVDDVDIVVSDQVLRYAAVTTVKIFLNPTGTDLP
jgi:Fe-S cluster assembly iron-binding protein IscA